MSVGPSLNSRAVWDGVTRFFSFNNSDSDTCSEGGSTGSLGNDVVAATDFTAAKLYERFAALRCRPTYVLNCRAKLTRKFTVCDNAS